MHARIARRGSVGALIVLLLAGSLVFGFAADRADAATHARRTSMLVLTNHDRTERGRADLSFNSRLSHYAKQHSREMASEGYLFHSSSDQLIKALSRYEWSLGGENVGVGGSLDSLETAFMQSKEHRKNILRRQFDHTAIGVVHDGDRLWVTVIFYG
jgi:uncharacterized protein YkwD